MNSRVLIDMYLDRNLQLHKLQRMNQNFVWRLLIYGCRTLIEITKPAFLVNLEMGCEEVNGAPDLYFFDGDMPSYSCGISQYFE